MGKFDGILIVSDIDGTFLGHGGRVVPENVEKIKYFISEGGLFTFATGRIYNTMEKKIPEVIELTNAPALLANGTYFYDFSSGEQSEEEFLDVDLVRGVLHYVKENHPAVEFRISTRDGQVTDSVQGPKLSDEYRRYRSIFGVYPIDKMPGDDWYKCVFRADANDITKLRADIEPRYSDAFTFTLSDPEFFELQKKGTSKGKKLLALKEKYAKEGKELTVYACGDYENDYEMLLAADFAVCPTSAIDMVKNIADICPCDNDDGLIAALIDIIESKL